MSYTKETIHAIVEKQRAYFHKGETLDVDFTIQGDTLRFENIHARLSSGQLTALNERTGETLSLSYPLTERQIAILLAGGLLNYTKEVSK